MTWISVIAALVGGFTSFFKWFASYTNRKLGAVETAYEAAKDAKRRAALRAKIQAEIRKLGPNELSARLRDRVRKSRPGND